MAQQPNERMLSIRIPYDVGRQLKAICALRGLTVREVATEWAQMLVDHADHLPSAEAPKSVELAALTQSVAMAEVKRRRKTR